MRTQEFVTRVQRRAGLADAGMALRASRATLLTLSERLPGEEPLHLRSQLPTDIARYLDEADHHGEGFEAAEFFLRVSGREGVDETTARDHARAVLRVVSEAVAPEEMAAVQRVLPPDFGQLFGEDRLLA